MRTLLPFLFSALPIFAQEYLPAEKIEAGMKGIGMTVFQGSRVDTFEVEILGVMRKVRPKGDIILARLSGDPLEKTGIIAGMSGSPIYIEGKLVGAVAFTWPFSKEPIAGITPITEMLRISEESGKEGMGLLKDLRFEVSGDLLGVLAKDPKTSYEMAPIETPLVLTGFDERCLGEARSLFEPYGLIPIQGGLAGEEKGSVPLLPGSAVGVLLITGDARAGALGTVTLKREDEILAFGHPFLWSGEVDFPMTNGYIHSILPSQLISFKIGSTGEIVGRLTQDRQTGILGKMGEFSQLIPVEVSVQGKEKTLYRFEVIEDEILTSQLVGLLSFNSTIVSGVATGELAMKTDLSIAFRSLKERHLIKQSDLLSGTEVSSDFAREVTTLLSSLLHNPYEKLEMESIRIGIDPLEGEERNANIEGLYVDKEGVKPGDALGITFFYRPHRGEKIRSSLLFQIPKDLPEGKLVVRVLDGKRLEKIEKEKGSTGFEHKNLSQFLEILQKERRSNDIWIQLVLSRKGLVIEGRELPALPSSLLSVLSTSKESGEGETFLEEVIQEERVPTEYVLTGMETRTLDVNFKDKKSK